MKKQDFFSIKERCDVLISELNISFTELCDLPREDLNCNNEKVKDFMITNIANRGIARERLSEFIEDLAVQDDFIINFYNELKEANLLKLYHYTSEGVNDSENMPNWEKGWFQLAVSMPIALKDKLVADNQIAIDDYELNTPIYAFKRSDIQIKKLSENMNENYYNYFICFNRCNKYVRTCEHCNENFLEGLQEYDDNDNVFCSYDCRDSHNEDYNDEESEEEIETRNADIRVRDYQSKSKNMVRYGIELEFKANDTPSNLASDLPKGFGIVLDGSVSNGYELVSPILAGRKGETIIQEVLEEIGKYQAFVDRQCGYHLHIDARDIKNNPEKLKNLIKIYFEFEDVLFSFLPSSRQANTYCKKLSDDYSKNDLINKNWSIEDIEKAYYKTTDNSRIRSKKNSKYEPERYYGLNLHSLFKEGHYEIRYHSGTVNYNKIKNWIVLHSKIKQLIKKSDSLPDIDSTSLYNKTQVFFDLIKLPKKIQGFYKQRQRLFSNRQLQEAN